MHAVILLAALGFVFEHRLQRVNEHGESVLYGGTIVRNLSGCPIVRTFICKCCGFSAAPASRHDKYHDPNYGRSYKLGGRMYTHRKDPLTCINHRTLLRLAKQKMEAAEMCFSNLVTGAATPSVVLVVDSAPADAQIVDSSTETEIEEVEV